MKAPWWLAKVSVTKVLTPKPLKLSWCNVTDTYWCRTSDDHCEGYATEGLHRGRFGRYVAFVSHDRKAVEEWLERAIKAVATAKGVFTALEQA